MDVTSIAAQTNAEVAGQRATTRGFDAISTEDFFALMVEELRSQDPLDPKDNQQLLQQMATIQQLEESSTLTKTLEALTDEQRFGSTSNLIGNYVLGTVRDSAGVPTDIDGLVIGVTFEGNGNAILNLHDGSRLPAKSVREVTLVENLPPEILEQLEQELGSIANGGSGGTTPVDGTNGDGSGDGATDGAGDGGDGAEGDPAGKAALAARANVPDREAAVKLLQKIRAQRAEARAELAGKWFWDGANTVGSIIDSLFSPGVGVRVGG